MCASPGRWPHRLSCLALGALAGTAASFSFGQQDSYSPALDEGAGRTARLVANAKREGSLSLYASLAEKDLIRLVSEFERRYGVKVNVWRSGKSNVLRRAVTEARAGRFEADVVHNPSPEMELLHRERLLQEVRSPYQRELIPAAVAPHRASAGPRVYIFVQADRLVRAATYGRLHRRNRRDEPRAASAGRGPLLRLRPERRPDIARGAEPRHRASPQRAVPPEIRLEVYRYRRGARRLRPLDEDLRGHHLWAKRWGLRIRERPIAVEVMLTAERNELLTRFGRGTPVGALF